MNQIIDEHYTFKYWEDYYANNKSPIPETILRQWKDYVPWRLVFFHQELSFDLIRQLKDYFDNDKWYGIIRCQTLNDKIIEEFWEYNKVWDSVGIKNKISVDFIRKWSERLNWEILIRYRQNLPEDLLEEKEKLLDKYELWRNVFRYQKDISYQFMDKYKNKVEEYTYRWRKYFSLGAIRSDLD